MNNKESALIIMTAIMGVVAVAMGAFGTHGLKPVLTAEQMEIFETAVKYHFYHVLAALSAALWYSKTERRRALYAGYTFLAGAFVFSGSLYLKSMSSLLGIDHLDWLGAVPILGGIAMTGGWLLLLYSCFKKPFMQ